MQKYYFPREDVRKISYFKGRVLPNLIGGFVVILFLLPHLSPAQNKVQGQKFIVEPPTLENLGFEWYIDGDENRNATVKVEYRIAGSGNKWKKGMPLLRIGGEHIERAGINYTTPHMFAGSILEVNPNTKYEARFTLEDPDGVEGEAVKEINVSTRAEPKAASGGRIRHVYSQYYTGEKEKPNYPGLVAAYGGSENTKGDWNVVAEDVVQPGDIIKIHGGLYQGVLLNYPDWHNIPFDGTYFFTAKGTAERPIVIEAAGDGEVIFDGAGAAILFNVMATEHHIFQGLTFRNAGRVFDAGRKHLAGASDLTIRNCRFENVGEGIVTEYAGSKNFLIQDNVLLGRDDRYRLYGWSAHREGLIPYGTHLLDSYYGIKVYGPGHVIAHNSIAFFHDAIGISTYGTPEKEQELKAVSIDIYNNDLHLMVDDFIEADGGVHNIRIMRNRGVNAAENGISAQPVFGGPAYYIRNILYNVPLGGALKIHGGVPGLTAYHNTFITENNAGSKYPNSNYRNNLILGTDGPVNVAAFPFTTAYSVADYNGYRPNQGHQSPENQFIWFSPRGEQAGFKTLMSLTKASGLEAHGITVDYDIFENLQKPIQAMAGTPLGSRPGPVYHAVDLNFKLNPRGKAVDAGIFIPNVNDNFTGKAPDLGALEVGSPPVIYGVRGLNQGHEFYR
ncbi:hypothetical protein LX87_05351 [Larkinella arboricola]|uniref:Parallel beta helix pectate lyase-like protein n=1 Tax=Larkinella arboricola TaxID=643671 RepID=A0A327WIQ3_LARAB|nr:hypothetical protein [Larkinella arboricola]RAJ91010.1 hypothetical protein LX87_05351 [Larkinella arboricola]